MQNKMDHRYVARIIAEVQTPLFVGTGEASFLTDALVQKDHNGLPMIQGTSLAGVLRHSFFDKYETKQKEDFTPQDWDEYFILSDLFGFQVSKNRKEVAEFEKWYQLSNGEKVQVPDGLGARLKISSAYFLLKADGENWVAEGVEKIIDANLMMHLEKLPTRQHVRITDKGVAAKYGLFDNEVVYKGARFVFEIELEGTKDDGDVWNLIKGTFQSPLFRIGQGTRNGYGSLKVVRMFEKCFLLTKPEDFEQYLNFDPSFNSKLGYEDVEKRKNEDYTHYQLSLTADDFFIFSEGFGDQEVDNKPLTEEVMQYNNHEINFVERTVIPASSIKGAISHRVCFHYNKKNNNSAYNHGNPVFADEIAVSGETNDKAFENYIREQNPAVAMLFGKKGEIKKKENDGQRGLIVLDDLYFDDINNSKIFNHVAIDRFTGGAIDGALFSEKVSRKKDGDIELSIYLSGNGVPEDVIAALEEALKDICKGLLPLGGMTTKGFGMFTGTLKKNGKKLFTYENVEA